MKIQRQYSFATWKPETRNTITRAHHSSFIINNPYPSPDSNGYPAVWVGGWVGLGVEVRWREE